MLNDLSGVSITTLNQVGTGASGVNSVTPTASSPPLTLNGKPEVLYMGAEYCPFCAAERWAMIVALDKFGNFTGIKYMQSSSTDHYPNTPTFTFVGATYTSNYISFVTVEQQDRNYNALQIATPAETSLLQTIRHRPVHPLRRLRELIRDNELAIFAGGPQSRQRRDRAPYNWTQIAPQLNNASSPYAQNIDGAANRLISAICKVDGGAPASVCSQSLVQTLSYTRTLSVRRLAAPRLRRRAQRPDAVVHRAPVRP